MDQKKTLEEQKQDLISAVEFLRTEESKINRQLFALREGIYELDKGEDMLSSQSSLAQKVREVMYELSQRK